VADLRARDQRKFDQASRAESAFPRELGARRDDRVNHNP
jgi:hypothetical protein